MKIALSQQLQALIDQHKDFSERARLELLNLSKDEQRGEKLGSILKRQSSEEEGIKQQAVAFHNEMKAACDQLWEKIHGHEATLKALKEQVAEIQSVCKHENDWADGCVICGADLYDPFD